jgi:hypothetical protein
MALVKSIVLGYDALKSPVSIAESVILGALAGHKHTHGYENIFIGKAAGFVSTGNRNIYIGSSAGHNSQGSGNIFLGCGTSIKTANNTLLIGNAICASLETGHTTIPSLTVRGDIVYEGSLIGEIHPSIVRRYTTNVGNLSGGYRTTTFGEHAGHGNMGENIVCLGGEAGYGNGGNSVVAIGEKAGYNNRGSNVIAIGLGAGKNNTESDTMFLGTFITGNTSELCLNRPVSCEGWEITQNQLKYDTLTITPQQIEGDGFLMASNLIKGNKFSITADTIRLDTETLTLSEDTFCFSGRIRVKEECSQTDAFFTGNLHNIIEIDNVFYGLSDDKHVYKSTGKFWTPIRSPKIDSLTKTHDGVMVGWATDTFVRYTPEGWISEKRDPGEYTCSYVMGSFAVGTPLSNGVYEDSGTILQRVGTEWQLYPGVYPNKPTCIAEWDGTIYAGGPRGLYELSDRRAKLLMSKPISCICSSPAGMLFASGKHLILNLYKTIHRFTSPITDIRWAGEWIIHTEDGVYINFVYVHPPCKFLLPKKREYKPSDITVPSSVRIGAVRLSEEEGTLLVNDGTHTGKVYDSVLNPLPITLEGISHISIQKGEGGSLCFTVLSDDGVHTHVSVSALNL